MAAKGKGKTDDPQNERIIAEDTKGAQSMQPRCLTIAARGVQTGSDFAELMSGLMSDVIEGRVTPSIANATCNAGGKLLKVVEMQMKYATTTVGQKRQLNLVEPVLMAEPESKQLVG